MVLHFSGMFRSGRIIKASEDFVIHISVIFHYTSEFLELLETSNYKVLTTVFHTSNSPKSPSTSSSSRIGPFDPFRLQSYSFSRQRFFGLQIVLLP